VVAASVIAPRHPPITRRHPQGSNREPEDARPAVARAHKVAHRTTGKDRHAVWRFARHQRVPQLSLTALSQHEGIEIPDPGRVRRDIDRFGNRGSRLRQPVHRRPLWRRQAGSR